MSCSTPLILELGMQMTTDLNEFQADQDSIVSSYLKTAAITKTIIPDVRVERGWEAMEEQGVRVNCC